MVLVKEKQIHLFGLAGFGGGESGASKTDSDECEARTPADSFPGSPVNKERSFGVNGISRKEKKILENCSYATNYKANMIYWLLCIISAISKLKVIINMTYYYYMLMLCHIGVTNYKQGFVTKCLWSLNTVVINYRFCIPSRD